MIGGTLGSYRVIKELGRGGMGAVYLAEHTLIGKKVAAKILLPQLSRDPEIVNRFFNEARAATQIRHPGIVEIFDFGQHESGCAYLVMEYLEGETLSMKLQREGGRLSHPWLIEVARQVASALRAAHEKGIVHRDLKPDNVFVVPDPDMPLGVRIKVLDFGIAKLSGDGDGSMKTRTGAVMGTPAYMSPEQCRGAGRVDARSDIYSLGCMMFEMGCGRIPFIGEGPGDVIGAHIFAPVPQPDFTGPLADLIVRSLQKTPDQRPQSMTEVLSTLESIGVARQSGRQQPVAPAVVATHDEKTMSGRPSTTLGGSAGEVSEVRPQPRSLGWIAPAAITVVAVLGVGGYVMFMRPQPAAVVAAKTDSPPTETVDPPPVKVDPAPEKNVHLSIDSQPSGADVYRVADGVRIGKTPLTEDVQRGNGEALYLLKLHGYRDSRVSLGIDHDVNKIVALEKSSTSSKPAAPPSKPAAPPSTKPAAPAKKPAKPVKNGVLDPFDN
jgi:serine/threonine-protein kinase